MSLELTDSQKEAFNGVHRTVVDFSLMDEGTFGGGDRGLVVHHDVIRRGLDRFQPTFLLKAGYAGWLKTLDVVSVDQFPFGNASTGMRCPLPRIPISVGSLADQALCSVQVRNGFPAESFHNEIAGSVIHELSTSGAHRHFDYYRVTPFAAGIEGFHLPPFKPGHGSIILPARSTLWMARDVADDLESQLFEGVLDLVVKLLKRWCLQTGIEGPKFSSAVDDVVRVVNARARQSLNVRRIQDKIRDQGLFKVVRI